MKFTESVRGRLPKQGRPRRGERRADTARYSLTVPATESKQLERIAATMGTSRHALSAAIIMYGLELLIAELDAKGGLPDAVRMVR